MILVSLVYERWCCARGKRLLPFQPEALLIRDINTNSPVTTSKPNYKPQPLPPPRLVGEGALQMSRARRRAALRARRAGERAWAKRVARGQVCFDPTGASGS